MTAAQKGAPPPPRRYWARFYGPFQVFDHGEPFARDILARSGPSMLLKWFLLHPGVSITATEIAALIGPGKPAPPARVYSTLHRLRRGLEPDLPPRAPSRYLLSDTDGRYWFDLAEDWDTDILRADDLLATAKRQRSDGDLDAATASLEHYLRLAAATFLPEDLYSPHLQEERAAQDVLRQRAHNSLLALYLEQNVCHRALALALEIQDRDPLNQAAARAIATVHLRTNSASAAVQHLESFLRDLDAEGMEPDTRLLALLARIRRRSSSTPPGEGP